MSSLIKESSITFLARGLVFILSMGTSIIVSRLLGPSLKGTFSVIILIISVVSLIMQFGLGSASIYYGARNQNELPIHAGNLMIASFGLGILGIILVQLILYVPAFNDYLNANGVKEYLIKVLILFLPLVQLKEYLPQILRAAGRIIKYNLVRIWHAFSYLILIIILLWIMQMGISGVINAWIISLILMVLFDVWLTIRTVGGSIKINGSLLYRSFKFGMCVYPGNIAQFLNYRLDVFIVGVFRTPAEIGYYVTAQMIAEKLWEIPEAIRTVLLYQVATSEDRNKINQTTARVSRVVFLIIGSICGLIVVTSYPLIYLMYGKAYLPVVPALILILPGIWMLSIGKLLVIHLIGSGHPKVGTICAIVSLAATVILDLLLIPNFGIIGASIASSTSYSIYTLLVSIIFLKVTNLRLKDIIVIKGEDIETIKKMIKNLWVKISTKQLQ